MKILILGNTFYPFDPNNLRGGIESFAYNIFMAMAKKQSLDPWIAGPSDSTPFTDKLICWRNPSKEAFITQNPGVRFSNYFGLEEFVSRVRQLCPDVIISNTESMAYLTKLIGLKIPIVQFAHIAPAYRDSVIKLNRLSELKSQSGLIKVVAVSEFLKQKINKVVDVVDEVLSPTYIEPQILFYPDHSGYLLYVGRISKLKGVDLLLEAFANANQRLVLVGDAPNNPPWELKWFEEVFSPKLKGAGNIKHLPNLPQRELFQLMSEAKALVIPIRDEAFSLVGFEAHKLGIPVIVNRGGCDSGVQTYIKNGVDGIYVQSHQKRRAAVLQSFRDAATQVGNLHKDIIYKRARRFSEGDFLISLLRICNSAINESKPQPIFKETMKENFI